MKRQLALLGIALGFIVKTCAHEDDPEVTHEHKELRSAAKAAAWNGDTVLIDSLLKAGLQINKPVDPEDGDTLLHVAVSSRKPATIRHLLTAGADPLVMNYSSWKPVDLLTFLSDAKEMPECLAALKRELTDYDRRLLNGYPVPVWREVLGYPAKAPDPLAPPAKDGSVSLVTFVSINDEDPAPEMKLVLDVHYAGWRPGSLIEPAEPPPDARHGSIIRDKKTKEFGEHVQITLVKASSKQVKQTERNPLAKLAREQELPAYEFKVRTTRGGALNGGGTGGHVVLIDGYWIKLGTYGWDE
jgi:hypothetical protein